MTASPDDEADPGRAAESHDCAAATDGLDAVEATGHAVHAAVLWAQAGRADRAKEAGYAIRYQGADGPVDVD